MSRPTKDASYRASVHSTFADAAKGIAPESPPASPPQPQPAPTIVNGQILNSSGNAAYVHRLKCWAESFDAILSGYKRAEVRAEEDRKFRAGDMLELTRTDRAGDPTEPRTRLVVEILHVERHAGPLELRGARVDDGGGIGSSTPPLAVLSLHTRAAKLTEAAAAPAAAK
jgi:hypothetical protein